MEGVEYFAAGLRLVPTGAQLARELELPATDELLWTLRHRDARPRGTFHLRAFTEATSRSERIEVLRRALLPTRRWIVLRYPWASGGPLPLIGAYGVHIARAPGLAARAWWFQRRARRARR